MIAFIARRLAQSVIVLVLVTMIAFFLLHLIPGDPVKVMLGANASQEEIDKLRAELWLDRSVPQQYIRWLSNLMQGDLGESVMFGEDVSELIAKRLPITFHLGIMAFLLSIAVGIPAGVISAVKRGGLLDQAITVVANLGIATPSFWLAILGVYFFGLKLGWLPIYGYTSPMEDLKQSTLQSIMPIVCLATTTVATLARQTRSSMLETIRQDYVRTAWSKGLTGRVVILRHALRNGLIPVVTLLGVGVQSIVGGSMFIETVFNIPGMGRLLVRSVFDKDYVITQGCIVVIAVVVALANLLVDISYGWLDPRIRYE